MTGVQTCALPICMVAGLQGIEQVFINGHATQRVPHNLNMSFMKEQIFAARKNPNVMAHPGTERRPLVWAAPHGCVELSGA